MGTFALQNTVAEQAQWGPRDVDETFRHQQFSKYTQTDLGVAGSS